jgi:hypothetical protein
LLFLSKGNNISSKVPIPLTLFGYLAHFRLVIWRISVWLFGAFPFGYLAHSDMVSAYINNPLFYAIYAFFAKIFGSLDENMYLCIQ